MRLQSVVLMGMLAIGIFSMANLPRAAHADDDGTSFVNVDISQTSNPNDQPFAISCDPNAVYMTIYNQGMLAKIDPVSKNVTLIQNPEGNATGGRNWYSMTRDSNGNYWINEQHTGRIWEYNPSGNGTWNSVPTLPELTESAVSYPLGYNENPGVIRVDTGASGFHTFGIGPNNFGDLVFADGQLLMGLSYNMTFDEESHTAGVSDRSFSGLITIDPDSLAVTYHTINGTIAPTGLSLDASDSNIVWISDQSTETVYKYNISTDTLLESYALPTNSNPKGIANDADSVYVAMEQNWVYFQGGDSEIMKIDKTTGNQTVIDTTAPIDFAGFGTFSVFVVNNYLIWTDLSSHVGSINLTNDAKTYVSTTFANENHFGCELGSDFWVAGHGSVKAGIIPLSELSPTIQPQTIDSDTQNSINQLFTMPVQTIFDNCKNLTGIESAAQPYDYFHHGTRAWVEYQEFQYVLSIQSDPLFKNLTELQKAWLFEKVKPQLDESFAWIQDA